MTGLAASLQKTTTFGDEATIAAGSLLLTFKAVRNEVGEGNDVFDRTIKAAQDMSIIFGGDLNQSTMQLGKAMEDPTRGMNALRRSGVSFTQQQQDQVKALQASGQQLEAQKIILAEVETQFGGSAEAMANTTSGKLKQAMNSLGDATESIGAIIAPLVTKVAGLLTGFANGFQALPQPIKVLGTVLAGLAAAVGPVIYLTGSLLKNLALIAKSRAGAAMIEAFAGLRSAVAGAVAQSALAQKALSGLAAAAKVLGGAAIGAVAVGAAIRMIGDAAAKAKMGKFAKDVKQVAAEFEEFKNTGRLTGSISDADALKRAMFDVNRELDVSSRRTNIFDNALLGLGMQIDGTFAAADAGRERLQNLDKALSEMSFRDAQQTMADYFEAMGMSMPTMEELTAMFPELAAKLEASTALTDPAARAIMGLGDAYDDTADDISEALKVLGDWEKKIRAQYDPLFAYQDATNKVADSQRGVAGAELELIAAFNEFGENSPQYLDARRKLEAADKDLFTAASDLKFEQGRLGASIAGQQVNFDSAKAMVDGLTGAQGLSADAADRVRREFFDMIAQILLTPEDKYITVRTNAGDVTTTFENLRRAFEQLPPGPFSAETALQNYDPGNAAGGPVSAGRMGWVGERGPELFIPSTDGVIVPHYESRRMMSDAGSGGSAGAAGGSTFNITINGMVGADKRDILDFLARELPKAAATHSRSFG
jgi:hypothetical protein